MSVLVHPQGALARDADVPRAVVAGVFSLLAALRELGAARVSELQRETGLPRTTVHRLLVQLDEVGAVERSGGRWRLGPTLVELGAGVPAEPRLRSVARRPLMDLANVSRACVVLSVEMAGHGLIIDVLAGARPLPLAPEPGMTLEPAKLAELGVDTSKMACLIAHERAHAGDLQPVIDAGGVHPHISCVAAPLRLSRHDVGAVWAMVPGGLGVPAPLVDATRRAAGRIASQLPGAGTM